MTSMDEYEEILEAVTSSENGGIWREWCPQDGREHALALIRGI